MSLPADSHVHTEWSWDAPDGDMIASCGRAVEMGLPAVAFTEHVDHTRWRVASEELEPEHLLVRLSTPSGTLTPPAFDAAGYLAAIEDCRVRFPGLRILSGLELGEPHRHETQVAEVLAAGRFDRVLGSVHTLPGRDGYAEPPGLFTHFTPAEVVPRYLAEVSALVSESEAFEVLAHIDYPVRSWPAAAGAFVPEDFEEEFRHSMRMAAERGRVLEVSTVLPFHATMLHWWHDEGGGAITFGSDAHDPETVARGFRDAVHLAEACGFRPGERPHDVWGRT